MNNDIINKKGEMLNMETKTINWNQVNEEMRQLNMLGDKEKINSEELFNKYSNENHECILNINGMKKIRKKDGSELITVFFVEEPTKFYFGGSELQKLYMVITSNLSEIEMNESLQKEPCKVKMTWGKNGMGGPKLEVTILN